MQGRQDKGLGSICKENVLSKAKMYVEHVLHTLTEILGVTLYTENVGKESRCHNGAFLSLLSSV